MDRTDDIDTERRTVQEPPAERTDWPAVSIVVPVYNDPEGLRETAETLTNQTYPDGAHEILLVDNDSTDETPAVARSYADAYDRVETFVEADRQSSYAARNEGIRRASGEILAFVDADMQVPAEWLVRAVTAMAERDVAYLGCNVEMVPSGDGESLAETYNRSTGFPIERYVEELGFAPTCCLLVRRPVFEDVGLFDPRLISSGDREFGHRVRDSGRELHFADDVTMYHPTRSTVGAILRKSRRIGRGFYQLRKHHPDRYGGRLPCALNPLPFVPPRYGRIAAGIEGWAGLSRRERMGYYLLSYARSATNGAGRIEETLRTLIDGDRTLEGSVPTLESSAPG